MAASSGGFKKGVSGNPGGRPRGFAGLAPLVRQATRNGVELLELQLMILRDERATYAERQAAAQWLTAAATAASGPEPPTRSPAPPAPPAPTDESETT